MSNSYLYLLWLHLYCPICNPPSIHL